MRGGPHRLRTGQSASVAVQAHLIARLRLSEVGQEDARADQARAGVGVHSLGTPGRPTWKL